MTGSKGFMLNTNKSINIGELIKHPTVLELEGIADDEEKALIIGFIMLNIYEYLKSQDNGGTSDLKHLIIMEEAHRIFSNVSSTENQEMVNTKGKSVETLSNILCEIRAYGEGFIIVDQVPTKLAPDVLKNTNVKIIHRLVSKDDCEHISKSIQIKDEDIDFISRLKVGEALTYCDSLEDTAHIKINFNKDQYKHYSNKDVHEFCMEYNEEIFADNAVHPLAETLLTYDSIKADIFKVTKKLLKAKLNNYCTGVKEELKYKVYELLNENGYSVDEIEENQNIIFEGINALKLEFIEENSDEYQEKLNLLIENFNSKTNKYVEERIELEKSSMSCYSNEYSLRSARLNDFFIVDCKKFISDLSKLKKSNNLLISVEEISKLMDKLIYSDLKYIKMDRKNLKKKLKEINIKTEKSLSGKSRLLIMENTKKYLTEVFNIYEKRVQILSVKERNSLEDKSAEYLKNEYKYIGNTEIKCTNSEEYKDLEYANNDNCEKEIANYAVAERELTNSKSIERYQIGAETEDIVLNKDLAITSDDFSSVINNNYSDINERINRHNLNNSIYNIEKSEDAVSASIINITVKMSNDIEYKLTEPSDEENKKLYEDIKQRIFELLQKQKY